MTCCRHDVMTCVDRKVPFEDHLCIKRKTRMTTSIKAKLIKLDGQKNEYK